MVNKTNIQAVPTTISIPKLRGDFKDRVIAPGDPDYDKARTVFYGGVDRHPAVIIKVADADDVSRVINLARESGLELAVRSGGHSSVGHSVTEGGIVLDLSNMKDLQIDTEARTAWAETGLTAGEVTTATGEHGLAAGFGDTGSVGIGGITLGGGVGYLVRKYGLTIDDLLAAEVVTADGQIRHVDEQTHPDLFWAIRGGGGNFGVATRFKFRLHEVPSVVGGMLILPATPDVVAGFIAEADAAPEELSGIANVMTAPPMPFLPEEVHGKLIIMAIMVYAGDSELGQRALAPFRALATPYADMLKPMGYPEIYQEEEGEYHPVAASLTMFVDQIDRSVAGTIVDRLQSSTASMAVAQLRVLGGAMARVPVDATAFAHRNSKIMVNIAALYEKPEEKATHEAWVADLSSA
jgi:FAD/FMN-containing dehydrogenase